MNSLSFVFSLLLFVPLFGESLQQFVFNSNGLSSDFEDHFLLSRRSYRSCPSLRWTLANGSVKMRSNNRVARFQCSDGFELVGERSSDCIRGRWNRQLPVCVSGTCAKLPVDARRNAIYSHESRVLDVDCDLGYYLKLHLANKSLDENTVVDDTPSKQRLFCLSGVWNVEASNYFRQDRRPMVALTLDSEYPTCEIFEHKGNDSHKCDYEDSLCNWFQDNSDDFDWTRAQYSTPSHLDRTGPSFDHTHGVNNSGYYLYLESSYPRVPGEKARLFSPVFHQNLTGVRNGCFRFYYHMYGSAIGTLRVFIMERSQVLKELTPRAELVGEQGQNWTLAEIELQPCENCSELNPFQIIFEGEIGRGHQGDIAIDDVHLELGKSCLGVNTTRIDIDPDIRLDMQREKLNITQDSSNSSDSSTPNVSVVSTVENSTTTAATTTADDDSTTKKATFSFRNPIINHIKAFFKPKNTTTTPRPDSTPKTALTTSNATTAAAATPTTTTSTATPPTTVANTQDDFEHMKWLAKLHEKLNKNRTKIDTATSESTTIAPSSTIQINNDSVGVMNTSNFRIASQQISQFKPTSPTQSSSSSSSWIIVLSSISLLALVVILLSVAAFTYDSSLNPLMFGTRNGLREFVSASFVRRNVARSNTNDDGELLVMEDSSTAGCANDYADDDQRAIYPTDAANNQSWLVYLK